MSCPREVIALKTPSSPDAVTVIPLSSIRISYSSLPKDKPVQAVVVPTAQAEEVVESAEESKAE